MEMENGLKKWSRNQNQLRALVRCPDGDFQWVGDRAPPACQSLLKKLNNGVNLAFGGARGRWRDAEQRAVNAEPRAVASAAGTLCAL